MVAVSNHLCRQEFFFPKDLTLELEYHLRYNLFFVTSVAMIKYPGKGNLRKGVFCLQLEGVVHSNDTTGVADKVAGHEASIVKKQSNACDLLISFLYPEFHPREWCHPW